jgi:NADPH:quinone reductase-like Zn-dependent oxidoreductase
LALECSPGVTVSGSYATLRNVDARLLVPAPETTDAAALVAAVLNGVTAWQMFHRVAHASPGDWVLVHGAAGGVGSLLLDFARLAGVKAIGAVSTNKLDAVKARGAEVLDYQRENVVARAKAISDGGVMAAFDHVGGRHFRKVTMPTLRRTGVGVLYGGYNATRGGKIHPFAIADLMFNSSISAFRLFGQSQGVVGYSVPQWRDLRPVAYREDLTQILRFVADGTIKPLVGATWPLTQVAAAHRALEGRSVTGKIVLLP